MRNQQKYRKNFSPLPPWIFFVWNKSRTSATSWFLGEVFFTAFSTGQSPKMAASSWEKFRFVPRSLKQVSPQKNNQPTNQPTWFFWGWQFWWCPIDPCYSKVTMSSELEGTNNISHFFWCCQLGCFDGIVLGLWKQCLKALLWYPPQKTLVNHREAAPISCGSIPTPQCPPPPLEDRGFHVRGKNRAGTRCEGRPFGE